MDITFTALAVLAASLLGGYGLRALIHSAGRRWLHLGADTVSVMGGIAFWGMLVGVLLAPRSGKETRAKVWNKLGRVLDRVLGMI